MYPQSYYYEEPAPGGGVYTAQAPVAATVRARAPVTRVPTPARPVAGIGIGGGAAPLGILPGVMPSVQAVPPAPGQIPPGGDADILGLLAGGGLLAGASALGLPAWAMAALGLGAAAVGGTGIATAFGMKFPWETPAGEGFIAPWTGETQIGPGLYGRTGVDYPGILEGFIPGQVAPYGKSVIVKIWNTNPAAPQYGQAFAMDADGWIYTQKKNGVVKRWKPPKHLVIPTNINKLPVGRLVRAERLIDRLMRKVAKRSPSLKLAK